MTFEIIVGAGQLFDLITVKQAWPVALTHGIEMPRELVEQRWELTLLVKHIEIKPFRLAVLMARSLREPPAQNVEG